MTSQWGRSGTGTGTVTALGINCGTDCSENYVYGTVVTLTATADTGSGFTSWTGCDSVNNNTCTVNMTANKSVSAAFTLNQHTLTVGKSGTGAGAITGTGISCGADCTETYPYNTPVTITAIPDATSDFTGWTGCDSTNSNTCTVTITGERSVSASFTRRTHDLTVGRSGTGTGTVTALGINCGTDCSENYVFGTVVNLTASANIGSTFTGWTGCDSVNSNTCTVTMTSNKSVSAAFTLNQHTLDRREDPVLARAPSPEPGSAAAPTAPKFTITGQLSSSPLRPIRVQGLPPGPGVTPPMGIPATVTMNGTKSVSATFTLNTYTLTATKSGTGSGSLTAPGLSCVGNTCTGTYNYNETVHITATADTGSVFGSWSGCDSVNGNVCTILINGDKNVTATFYLEYTLRGEHGRNRRWKGGQHTVRY